MVPSVLWKAPSKQAQIISWFRSFQNILELRIIEYYRIFRTRNPCNISRHSNDNWRLQAVGGGQTFQKWFVVPVFQCSSILFRPTMLLQWACLDQWNWLRAECGRCRDRSLWLRFHETAPRIQLHLIRVQKQADSCFGYLECLRNGGCQISSHYSVSCPCSSLCTNRHTCA